MQLLFPLVLIAAVYFLMLRPQQQRVARQRTLVNSVETGDEIVTAGGIIGRVARMDDERLWLEVAPGVEITLLRGAIAQKVVPPVPDDADQVGDDDSHNDSHDEGVNGL